MIAREGFPLRWWLHYRKDVRRKHLVDGWERVPRSIRFRASRCQHVHITMEQATSLKVCQVQRICDAIPIRWVSGIGIPHEEVVPRVEALGVL